MGNEILTKIGEKAEWAPAAGTATDAKLNDFIVTFTFDDSRNIVSDKMFDEIFEAYKAGKKVSGLIVNGSNDWTELLVSTVNGSEIEFFSAMSFVDETAVGIIIIVRFSSDTGISVIFGSLTSSVS